MKIIFKPCANHNRGTQYIAIACLTVLAYALTACSDKSDSATPNTPVSPIVPADEYQTVPTSGGTVVKDDLSIIFPPGTFSQDEQVGLSEVTASEVSQAPARSKFYRLYLPTEGTSKDITLSLRCEGVPDDAIMVVRAKGLNNHTGETQEQTIMLESTATNGARTATISNLDATEGKQIVFVVGLIENPNPASSSAPIRRKEKEKTDYSFSVSYNLGWNVKSGDWWYSFLGTYYAKKNEMLKFVEDNLPNVFETLKANGFDMIPGTLHYYITTEDGYGAYTNSMIKSSWGCLNISVGELYNAVNGGDPKAMKATLMHETLHAIYDQVYDQRPAPIKVSEGIIGDDWQILDEAMGCWVEKLSVQGTINAEVTVANGGQFLKSYFPLERNMTFYRNQGYGMALFLEYLASKTSNKDMHKLFDYRRSQGQLPCSALDAVYSYCTKYNINVKTMTDYMDFLKYALEGRAVSNFNFTNVDFCFDHIKGRKNDLTPVFFKDPVYAYGATIKYINLQTDKSSVKEGLEKNDMKIQQSVEGLTTYVYGIENISMQPTLQLVGTATSETDCYVSGADLLSKYNGRVILITVNPASTYTVSGTVGSSGAAQDLYVTFTENTPEVHSIILMGTIWGASPDVNEGEPQPIDLGAIINLAKENNSITTNVINEGRDLDVVASCYETNSEYFLEFVIENYQMMGDNKATLKNIDYQSTHTTGYEGSPSRTKTEYYLKVDKLPMKAGEKNTWYARGSSLGVTNFYHKFTYSIDGYDTVTDYQYTSNSANELTILINSLGY